MSDTESTYDYRRRRRLSDTTTTYESVKGKEEEVPQEIPPLRRRNTPNDLVEENGKEISTVFRQALHPNDVTLQGHHTNYGGT